MLGKRETREGPRFQVMSDSGIKYDNWNAAKVSGLVRAPHLSIKAPACKSALTSIGNMPSLLACPIELA